MNDDDPSRSSSSQTQGLSSADGALPHAGRWWGRPVAGVAGADAPVKGLFIILTGLLVLVNAFFVIAEYALVRSRRERLEALAEEGRGARAGA